MPVHYCKGDTQNKIAFILSTPGKREGELECPAAGDTGDNMNGILAILSKSDPIHFPNIDRYRYLITNASTKVMHSAKNDKKTEDADKNVTKPQNVDRVRREIENCTIVILCGKKAKLLAPHLSDKVLIQTSHLGNVGLRNTYRNNDARLKGISSAKNRDIARLSFCANSISEQLHRSTAKNV